MSQYISNQIQLSDKALSELKEALYLEIGNAAATYTPKDLNAFGNFILTVVAISYKMKLKALKKKQKID